MAIDAPSSSIFSLWPDRLRHSAIILLTAGLALAVLVAFGELSLVRAAAVFICIGAAALVPWRCDDLRARSRVERSAHVGPDTLVNIVPIIRQVADGLEPLARERQVTIDIDLPETPVTIAGDREELLRLFENLIENALKYGASGGKVVVSLSSAVSE